MSSRLSSTTNWRELLLERPSDAELAASLPDFLKLTAQSFIASVRTSLTPQDHRHADRWYHSSEGQAALAEFTLALWNQMSAFASHAMPAHDARHAMYKVPASALEFLVAEKINGWERVGILGALLHDHGRWAEERIYGHPGASVLHARLSFLLGRELIDKFEMPELIKHHILLSAIRHTSGAWPEDPMPLKITVSADREQLYGPEIILRLAHHPVEPSGAGGTFYAEDGKRSVLDQLERYLTCRLPGPLFSRDEHSAYLWDVLVNFLMLAESPLASRTRFERAFSDKAAQGSALDWEQRYAALEPLRTTAHSPRLELEALLGAAHLAPGLQHREMALAKVDRVSEDNQPRLAMALRYAHGRRVALDQAQLSTLNAIATANPADQLIQVLANQLTSTWTGLATSKTPLSLSSLAA